MYAILGSGGSSKASLTLTPAGTALGLSLSTFATGFPSSSTVGPLGIAFLSTGGVLVTDYPGNVRFFATDSDNQVAPAPLINYGLGNAHGLATIGGNIYMTQKFDGDLAQINPNGTLNQVIVKGLNTPLAVIVDPANNHLLVSTASGIMDIDPVAKTTTTLINQAADGLTISQDGSTIYGAISGHILGFNTSTKAQVFDSGFITGSPDGTALGLGPLAGNIFSNNNDGSLVEINLLTKAQTLIATGGSRGDFVSVDPNNGTLLLTQTDRIIRLNGADFGTVPEPASIVLVGLGCLGPIAYGLRRTRRKAG